MLFFGRVGAHPWNSNRSHDAEEVSPRFHGQLHPSVTDLASQGDARRFPRIIILLSYNSSNSWIGEAGIHEDAHLHPRGSNAARYAHSPLVNERRRDADAHGNTEIGTFYRGEPSFVRFTSKLGEPSSRTRHAFELEDFPTARGRTRCVDSYVAKRRLRFDKSNCRKLIDADFPPRNGSSLCSKMLRRSLRFSEG